MQRLETRAHAGADPGPGGPPRAATRVLVVANQKGGVGKTTTAISVAAALGELGVRVLLVDLDPQANATSGIGVRVSPDQPTVYEALIDEATAADVVVASGVANVDLAPATLELAGAEVELVTAFSREQRLRRALEPVRGHYDLVLVDCPPSLGLLTVNALSAGDRVLVPIQCEYYALEGIGALRRNTELVRRNLNPSLEVLGYVLTMLDTRTRLSQQVADEVRTHFGGLVFSTLVPRSVRLAEAPGFGQPITVFDTRSRAAAAYRRLAGELLERLGGPPGTAGDEGGPT
ncbi:MAG: AAA family ATPase [Actinobacteria bacterium]|nr:AAA family ATPase [Actinomycetota bacterium]